jgi:5-methylcytosine-specific restriction protein A
MKKVTCAGCMNNFNIKDTSFYRNKRCCGEETCIQIIDEKIKNFNYKKKQQRILKGTFRNGVSKDIRDRVIERDDCRCRLCKTHFEETFMVQIHHVVPVSSGGSDEDNNLCTLCRKCHMKVHSDGWEKYVWTFQVSSRRLEKTAVKA